MWKLCPDSGYEVELEEDPNEDEDGGVGGNIDEFDRIDISEGVDDMHDEDIFKTEEVMDESNIYKWGGLSVIWYIWYYTILYGIIQRSPRIF